jgi:hypothetical protein
MQQATPFIPAKVGIQKATMPESVTSCSGSPLTRGRTEESYPFPRKRESRGQQVQKSVTCVLGPDERENVEYAASHFTPFIPATTGIQKATFNNFLTLCSGSPLTRGRGTNGRVWNTPRAAEKKVLRLLDPELVHAGERIGMLRLELLPAVEIR